MQLTTDIFLWASGIILSIGVTLLILILLNTLGIRSDLKPITSLVKSVEEWIRDRGMDAVFLGKIAGADTTGHSLSPELAAERDRLISIAKVQPLPEPEATRLRQLLRDDALNDLAKGAIGILAFIGIMAVIAAMTRE